MNGLFGLLMMVYAGILLVQEVKCRNQYYERKFDARLIFPDKREKKILSTDLYIGKGKQADIQIRVPASREKERAAYLQAVDNLHIWLFIQNNEYRIRNLSEEYGLGVEAANGNKKWILPGDSRTEVILRSGSKLWLGSYYLIFEQG